MTALQAVGRGIWTAEAPLRFIGLQVGRRMTVVRLASGELWVHSPAPLDDALRDALAALGRVRFVIAASLLHGHVSMGDYAAAKRMLDQWGVVRPEMQRAIDGLKSLPTDIDPVNEK